MWVQGTTCEIAVSVGGTRRGYGRRQFVEVSCQEMRRKIFSRISSGSSRGFVADPGSDPFWHPSMAGGDASEPYSAVFSFESERERSGVALSREDVASSDDKNERSLIRKASSGTSIAKRAASGLASKIPYNTNESRWSCNPSIPSRRSDLFIDEPRRFLSHPTENTRFRQ